MASRLLFGVGLCLFACTEALKPTPEVTVSRRASSADATRKNNDFVTVPAGATVTLFDIKGSGEVRHFWMTLLPASRALHRQMILRMYWDGEETPSVETPLGDFFGVGFGDRKDFVSSQVTVTSGGYNSWWSMPYRSSARWTLTNTSDQPIERFYFNIDYAELPQPEATQTFHAQFRRENPTSPNKPYTIVEVGGGAGRFMGVVLSIQSKHTRVPFFLEGNEEMFIDGAAAPTIVGTGTEDYFGGGWYFDTGPFAAPFHGAPMVDFRNGRLCLYRWHIPDPVHFKKAFRFTIEHGMANSEVADYSSVAFWYQQEPHAPQQAISTRPVDLLAATLPKPYRLDNLIEGESLLATLETSGGETKVFGFGNLATRFSDDLLLLWLAPGPNATLTLRLPVGQIGWYEVWGYFSKSDDHAKFQFSKDGVGLGDPVDLYDPDAAGIPSGPVRLGKAMFQIGPNSIELKVVGRDAKATGYAIGIDGFMLRAAKRP